MGMFVKSIIVLTIQIGEDSKRDQRVKRKRRRVDQTERTVS